MKKKKTDCLQKTEFAEENDKLTKEINDLLEEMDYVKKVSEEKEKHVHKKLVTLEKENEELKLKLHVQNKRDEEMSLFEEIQSSNPSSPNKSFECEVWETESANKKCLGDHKKPIHVSQAKKVLSNRLREIENQVCEQKIKLTSAIYNLKEMELNARLTCSCIGWCNITHLKHNWVLKKSEKYFNKFDEACQNKS